MLLKFSVCHKNDLQILSSMGNDLIKNVRQQLRPFLDRVQPGRPEKQRRIFILYQAQLFLKNPFVFFSCVMIFRTVGRRRCLSFGD